jgi:hypothetical protein
MATFNYCQKPLPITNLEKSQSLDQRSSNNDSFSGNSGRLKLNLQVSDKAWKEYTRRSKEVSEVLNISLEPSTSKAVFNVSALVKEISSMSLSSLVDQVMQENKDLESENWFLASRLEESQKDSFHSIDLLEHNLVSVLKQHVRFFQSHLSEIQSKLENFEEKIKSFIFGLLETVNSRLAHLEFKLSGITTFTKSLRHSLISSQSDLFNLQSNYKDIIHDKQYLTEKLDEGFQLSKYLASAVKTLAESKEFFEKVANVYQSKKTFEVFFEKLQFFEDSIEELHKHLQEANPYRNKLELLERENCGLYEEIERLRTENQKLVIREALEVKINENNTLMESGEFRREVVSPLLSPRLSVAANFELIRILPGKISKVLAKFDKNFKIPVLGQLEENQEKLETLKLWVKKAKLVQVSMKKKILDMESKERMYMKEINKITSENLKLVNNLDEARSKLKGFSTENDELSQKIEKVFKEIQTRNNEKSQLVSQNNEFKIKLSQLESEVKQLKKTNEKVFYEYEKITAENQQNLLKRQEITLVFQTMEDKLRGQQDLIDQLKAENQDLTSKHSSFDKNIKMYKNALEGYEARVKDAELQLIKKNSEENSKTEEMTEKIQILSMEIENKDSLIKDLEVRNWNLEQKRMELTAKVKELKKENEIIREETTKNPEKPKETLPTEFFNKDLESLTRKHDRANKKLEKFRQSLEEKDKINEELSSVVERCLKEIELLQNKYKHIKSKSKNLKKSLVSVVVNTRSMHTSLKTQASHLFYSFHSDFSKVLETFKHDPKSFPSFPVKRKTRRPKNQETSSNQSWTSSKSLVN